jgi:exodeoxyribonuclease VII small subunit
MSEAVGYEAARAELAEVVRRLEAGGQTLEESLALWERGEELADICQRWLEGASARLEEAVAARENNRDGHGATSESDKSNKSNKSNNSNKEESAT